MATPKSILMTLGSSIPKLMYSLSLASFDLALVETNWHVNIQYRGRGQRGTANRLGLTQRHICLVTPLAGLLLNGSAPNAIGFDIQQVPTTVDAHRCASAPGTNLISQQVDTAFAVDVIEPDREVGLTAVGQRKVCAASL
jgi:hypothetical protein